MAQDEPTYSDPRQHPRADVAKDVREALTTRRSVRGFLPDPIPTDVVRDILTMSARAPSGTNMQPWQAYVLTGDAKQRLSERVLEIHYTPAGRDYSYPRPYYPSPLFEPYIGRRRQVGWELYGLCGIKKGDKEKMVQQHGRNYEYFGAPVALMFTIHRELEIGSWLDFGMFLQNIMTAARAYGLHTCPQAAWAQYNDIIAEELQLDESELVVCGMSMGYEDTDVPENALRTPRADLEEWVTFVD